VLYLAHKDMALWSETVAATSVQGYPLLALTVHIKLSHQLWANTGGALVHPSETGDNE